MSTHTARKALDDNLKRYVNARTDPVTHNLCVALRALAGALDDIEAKIEHVSKQVAQVVVRQR